MEVRFRNQKEFFDAIDNSTEFEEYKDEKLYDFDSEKGFVDVITYLKRVSDGKKFTAQYTRGGQGDRWVSDSDFVFHEIVPKVRKPKRITYTETEAYNLVMAIVATSNVLRKKGKEVDAENLWEKFKKRQA